MTASVIDPRTQRAIEIASDAGQFARCRTYHGEVVWGVPSQTHEHLRYLVTERSCDCEDFRRNGLRYGRIGFHGAHFVCKHIRALRILLSAWNAQRTPEDPDLVLEQLPNGEFAWLKREDYE